MEYGEVIMKNYVKEINFQYNGDDRGSLVIVESNKIIPFDIKRLFYIYGVKDDKSRGNHANIDSEFVMVALKGNVTVMVDNGFEKIEYVLDDPKKGIYLPKLTWKSMYNFSEDSILLVIANTLYNKDEYINDYEQFKKYVKENS